MKCRGIIRSDVPEEIYSEGGEAEVVHNVSETARYVDNDSNDEVINEDKTRWSEIAAKWWRKKT